MQTRDWAFRERSDTIKRDLGSVEGRFGAPLSMTRWGVVLVGREGFPPGNLTSVLKPVGDRLELPSVSAGSGERNGD